MGPQTFVLLVLLLFAVIFLMRQVRSIPQANIAVVTVFGKYQRNADDDTIKRAVFSFASWHARSGAGPVTGASRPGWRGGRRSAAGGPARQAGRAARRPCPRESRRCLARARSAGRRGLGSGPATATGRAGGSRSGPARASCPDGWWRRTGRR